mgnify:CR=1 FL=1
MKEKVVVVREQPREVVIVKERPQKVVIVEQPRRDVVIVENGSGVEAVETDLITREPIIPVVHGNMTHASTLRDALMIGASGIAARRSRATRTVRFRRGCRRRVVVEHLGEHIGQHVGAQGGQQAPMSVDLGRPLCDDVPGLGHVVEQAGHFVPEHGAPIAQVAVGYFRR